MSEASVIGPTTVVRGNVHGAGDLEIQGRVEGDISVTGNVLVAENSSVRGNISAAELTVVGSVEGNLRASETLIVESRAKVVGDLHAPRVGISIGAEVRGNVRTDGEAAIKQPEPRRLVANVQTLRTGGPTVRALGGAGLTPMRSDHVRLVEPEEAEEFEQPVKNEGPKLRPDTERQPPPPPVVPALSKGAKAKRKKGKP